MADNKKHVAKSVPKGRKVKGLPDAQTMFNLSIEESMKEVNSYIKRLNERYRVASKELRELWGFSEKPAAYISNKSLNKATEGLTGKKKEDIKRQLILEVYMGLASYDTSKVLTAASEEERKAEAVSIFRGIGKDRFTQEESIDLYKYGISKFGSSKFNVFQNTANVHDLLYSSEFSLSYDEKHDLGGMLSRKEISLKEFYRRLIDFKAEVDKGAR